MNPVVTRMVSALVMALIAPHLQETTGIKLTNADVYTLIGLTPLAWHVIAAAWAKIVAAFVLYFPPPNPSGPTAPKA